MPIKPPVHVQARQRIIDVAESLRAQGVDRLPPERRLSAELGFSLTTIKKAIRQLVLEDRLATAPRDGHFILGRRVGIDIGLIVGEGGECTYVNDAGAFGAICAAIQRIGAFARILRVCDPAQAPDLIERYRIHGCVWYMPHLSRLSAIGRALRSCRVPVAVVIDDGPLDGKSLPDGIFALDYEGIGRLRTEWLLARGHRRILYSGQGGSPAYRGHIAALREAGLGESDGLQITEVERIGEELPRMLAIGPPTAIVSDGGYARLAALYTVLEDHPWSVQGTLMVDDIGHRHDELLRRHPRMRIAAINQRMSERPALRAVAALDAAIRGGEPLRGERTLSRIVEMTPASCPS